MMLFLVHSTKQCNEDEKGAELSTFFDVIKERMRLIFSGIFELYQENKSYISLMRESFIVIS